MKKLLLLGSALVSITAASAQFVITAAQGPIPGDINYNYVDTMPYIGDSAQASKGLAGADQTWDFESLDLDLDDNSAYNDPAVSGFASDFPEADVITDFQGLGTAFLDVTSTGVEWIGIAIEDGGFIPAGSKRLQNPETFAKFPSAFESSYSDEAKLQYSFAFDTTFSGFDLDSARINYTSTKDIVFDAYGTVKTPFGVFENTLREKALITTNTSFEVCVKVVPILPCQWLDASAIAGGSVGGGEATNIVYSWYGAQSKFPLAALTYNETDDTLQTASFNGDDKLLSIGTTPSGAQLVMYPNPAKDKLTFSNAQEVKSIRIIDITGKEVINAALASNGTLEVSALNNGLYMTQISFKNNTSVTYRLTIQK